MPCCSNDVEGVGHQAVDVIGVEIFWIGTRWGE